MENSRFDNFPIELAKNPQDVQDAFRIFNLTEFNEYFNNSIPSKSLEFWVSIYHYKDSVGNHLFRNISKFALKLLCLPISNATDFSKLISN
ncbi:hypothetical protein A3Q56_08160 [Intoshia linei]|uniref:HAT C-terminal dimerisation domain-containing protein n=1 Tax=Intoshia linei TaxID=1819745 RepID=A0A177ASB9_9BILA|nr:hypothetical protein A3Q56_08160 [Intoshia linei]